MSDLANDLAGSLAVEVHHRLAELIIVFQSIASDQGCPLTEVQAVLLAQIAMQTFDGTEAALAHHLSADAGLRTGNMGWLLGHDL